VPFFVRGPRQAGPPCTPRLAPQSPLALGERPAALLAVRHSDGPGGHPLVFGALPTPTFLQSVSPWDQEGFTCSDTTPRCVLPSLPRRNPPQPTSVLPRPVLPSPVLEWLGFRTCVHGACLTFDTCGPQRRFPALPPDLSGGTAPCFRDSNASPQLRSFLALTTSRLSLAGLHRLSQVTPGTGTWKTRARGAYVL